MIYLLTFINDSFANDDNFLVVMLLFALLFFVIAGIVIAVLLLILAAILAGLILAGVTSFSVLVGLYQRSLSKGFKVFFISSFSLACIIAAVIISWLLNNINEWWSTEVAIILGILVGIVTGALMGLLVTKAIIKTLSFLKTKFINRE